MPNGPWESVVQTISGPSSNRSASSAVSMLRVTSSLEFGLMTRMVGRRALIGGPLQDQASVASLIATPLVDCKSRRNRLATVCGWVLLDVHERGAAVASFH